MLCLFIRDENKVNFFLFLSCTESALHDFFISFFVVQGSGHVEFLSLFLTVSPLHLMFVVQGCEEEPGISRSTLMRCHRILPQELAGHNP